GGEGRRAARDRAGEVDGHRREAPQGELRCRVRFRGKGTRRDRLAPRQLSGRRAHAAAPRQVLGPEQGGAAQFPSAVPVLAAGQLSSVDLDFHRSTTDNTLNARSGYTVDAHLEQAGRALRGDYEFVETILEGRYYAALGQRAVVAVKVRGGSIGAISGDENLKV